MTDRLKIGQEVLIHGYVDEIRKDTVIIRNDGGYFGTVEYEITDIETPNTNEVLNKIRAKIKALSNANPSYWHSGDMVEREEVFEIIDKYRVEGEPQEISDRNMKMWEEIFKAESEDKE